MQNLHIGRLSEQYRQPQSRPKTETYERLRIEVGRLIQDVENNTEALANFLA
jgi:hypothetical protein